MTSYLTRSASRLENGLYVEATKDVASRVVSITAVNLKMRNDRVSELTITLPEIVAGVTPSYYVVDADHSDAYDGSADDGTLQSVTPPAAGSTVTLWMQPRSVHLLQYDIPDPLVLSSTPAGGLVLSGSRTTAATFAVSRSGGIRFAGRQVSKPPPDPMWLEGRIGLATTLGVSEESSWGTYRAPTRWLPFFQEKLGRNSSRIVSQAILSGRRTLQTSAWASGPRSAGGSLSLPIGIVNYGLVFKHMLGAVTTTADGKGYRHRAEVDSLNGLGQTWEVKRSGTDGNAYGFAYVGGKITGWKLTQGDGFLSLELEYDFRVEDTSQGVTAAKPPTFDELFAWKNLTVSLAGAPFDADGVQLSGAHQLDTSRYPIEAGQRKNEQLEKDMRVYGGSLSGEFESMTQYNRFVNADPTQSGTMVPLVLTRTAESVYDTNKPYKLVITLPAVRFDGTTPAVSGAGPLQGVWPFTALDAGDGPITIDYYTSDYLP